MYEFYSHRFQQIIKLTHETKTTYCVRIEQKRNKNHKVKVFLVLGHGMQRGEVTYSSQKNNSKVFLFA